MPVKVSDKLENSDSNSPLLDSSISASTGGYIRGFGIFDTISDRDAVPANKRCYGYMAIVLQADGSRKTVDGNGYLSFFGYTNTPGDEYDFNDDGNVNTSDSFPLQENNGRQRAVKSEDFYGFGSMLRVYVYKTYPHGYIVTSDNPASSGTTTADGNIEVEEEPVYTDEIGVQDWTNADNWLDVTLGANAYRKASANDVINDWDRYGIPVHNFVTNENYNFSANDLGSWILEAMVNTIIEAGYGTVNTYTGATSGLLGDFDDDGLVTVSDLLQFLGNYGGNTGVLAATNSVFALNGSQLSGTLYAMSSLLNPIINGGSAYSSQPTEPQLLAGTFDYQTGLFFAQNQTSATAGSLDVQTNIGNSNQDRSTFSFVATTSTSLLDAMPKINIEDITTIDVAGDGTVAAGSVNFTIGLVFRTKVINDQNVVLDTKYTLQQYTVTNASSSDSAQIQPFTVLDFNSLGGTGADELGLTQAHREAAEKITIEVDYYAPTANDAVVLALSLGFKARCIIN